MIQARRLQDGQLDIGRPVGLQGGQVAYVGDIIQTRRNDRHADVENRQQWTITGVSSGMDGSAHTVRLASLEDAGVVREVAADYVAEHAHLSYAATVHGVQGETTDRALVGPGVDAAGLYVGLTRGREHSTSLMPHVMLMCRSARTESLRPGTTARHGLLAGCSTSTRC
jgi:ATP-dependent exoDNAse (exonuclease V) alpha subunit